MADHSDSRLTSSELTSQFPRRRLPISQVRQKSNGIQELNLNLEKSLLNLNGLLRVI